MKESFLLYKAFYEPIKYLTDEQMGRLFRAIYEYQINGSEPQADDVINMAFMFFKNQFRLDNEKYSRLVEKQRDNGKKGGRPKKETLSDEPKETQKSQAFPEEPTKAYNENDNVNDNEKENVNEKVSLSAKRGVPAAGGDTEKFRSAVLKIFFFKGFVSPMAEVDKFFAHYAKTGWMDGNGNRIRDIPAAAQCWEQKPPKNGKAYPLPTAFIQKWEQVYKAYEAIDPDRAPLLLEVFTIQPTNTTMNIGISERLHQAFPTLTDFFPIYNQFFNLELRIKVIKR